MRNLQIWVIVGVALVGFFASGLWFYTGQKSWKGVMLERKVNRGEDISAETLVQVWDHVRDLDRMFLTGRHVHLPGLASRLVVADENIAIEKRAEVLVAGEDSVRNALAREPANSHAWARLAWFRYVQGGPSKDVVDALRMSIYTAPAKNSLLFWRIEMARLNRDYWTPEFEHLVNRQTAYAARVSQKQLDEVMGRQW